MSVFTPIKKFQQPKVHYSQYIRTAHTSDKEESTPEAPATKPADPETK